MLTVRGTLPNCAIKSNSKTLPTKAFINLSESELNKKMSITKNEFKRRLKLYKSGALTQQEIIDCAEEYFKSEKEQLAQLFQAKWSQMTELCAAVEERINSRKGPGEKVTRVRPVINVRDCSLVAPFYSRNTFECSLLIYVDDDCVARRSAIAREHELNEVKLQLVVVSMRDMFTFGVVQCIERIKRIEAITN